MTSCFYSHPPPFLPFIGRVSTRLFSSPNVTVLYTGFLCISPTPPFPREPCLSSVTQFPNATTVFLPRKPTAPRSAFGLTPPSSPSGLFTPSSFYPFFFFPFSLSCRTPISENRVPSLTVCVGMIFVLPSPSLRFWYPPSDVAWLICAVRSSNFWFMRPPIFLF